MTVESIYPYLEINAARWGGHSVESIHHINDTFHQCGYRINAPTLRVGPDETIVIFHTPLYLKEKKAECRWMEPKVTRTGMRVIANTIADAIDQALVWWETKPGIDLDKYHVFTGHSDC